MPALPRSKKTRLKFQARRIEQLEPVTTSQSEPITVLRSQLHIHAESTLLLQRRFSDASLSASAHDRPVDPTGHPTAIAASPVDPIDRRLLEDNELTLAIKVEGHSPSFKDTNELCNYADPHTIATAAMSGTEDASDATPSLPPQCLAPKTPATPPKSPLIIAPPTRRATSPSLQPAQSTQYIAGPWATMRFRPQINTEEYSPTFNDTNELYDYADFPTIAAAGPVAYAIDLFYAGFCDADTTATTDDVPPMTATGGPPPPTPLIPSTTHEPYATSTDFADTRAATPSDATSDDRPSLQPTSPEDPHTTRDSMGSALHPMLAVLPSRHHGGMPVSREPPDTSP